MSKKVTRAEITKNHWINKRKERGLREVEEVDKNKRMGSDRGRGSRRQEQEAREEWRGPGRGGKPWKGGGTREG